MSASEVVASSSCIPEHRQLIRSRYHNSFENIPASEVDSITYTSTRVRSLSNVSNHQTISDDEANASNNIVSSLSGPLDCDSDQNERPTRNSMHGAIGQSSDAKTKLKIAKLDYKREKKRREMNLTVSLNDASSNMKCGPLKMRGALKTWAVRYFMLRPGVLYYGKDDKEWYGSILLSGCEVVRRPSKKEGFCFKIYHPFEHYIYGTKGPRGEPLPFVADKPLHQDHCILRTNYIEGKKWVDAINRAIKTDIKGSSTLPSPNNSQPQTPLNNMMDSEEEWLDSDGDDLDDDDGQTPLSSQVSGTLPVNAIDTSAERQLFEKMYYPFPISVAIGVTGAVTEEWGEESKNLLFTVLKQVRPGMDLSKVPLPTFILEPRSFLEKLSDFYSHSDLLASAARTDSALQRMAGVVQCYCSGFYIKPTGLKKPYNPILGESFRCAWDLPDSTTAFFVGEQVSHHPPVTAWFVSNRKAGYCINGSVLCKTKFNGNSAGTILDGRSVISLLPWGEDYECTLPTMWGKGFIFSPLLMEMGGDVTISCAKTGMVAQLEFERKPVFGGTYNVLSGKIKSGKMTLLTISGHWDDELILTDVKDKSQQILWNTSKAVRLVRRCIRPEYLEPNESVRLWSKVTAAIEAGDQVLATEEKCLLESKQRQEAKDRKDRCEEYQPKFFRKDGVEMQYWTYKCMNKEKWVPGVDILEYERDGFVFTKSRERVHRSPTTGHRPLRSSWSHAPTSKEARHIGGGNSETTLSSCDYSSNGKGALDYYSQRQRRPFESNANYENDVSSTISHTILTKLEQRFMPLETTVALQVQQLRDQLVFTKRLFWFMIMVIVVQFAILITITFQEPPEGHWEQLPLNIDK